MLNALIVDDEELARRGLTLRLEKYDDIRVAGECRNGREVLAAVAEQRPDIIFLDIQMPGMDGFEVLKRLAGSDMPAIVFVTAFDKFALQAFEANAMDYLLKPINDERLADAVDRARLAISDREAAEQRTRLLKFICALTGRELTLDAALEEADGKSYPRKLAIRDGREQCCVEVADIDWVDAAGDYMCVHAAGDTYVLRGTMKQLEQVLDPGTFVRVHRSAIVNRHRVRSLTPHRNGEYFLKLECDHELKLSRKYKTNLARFADNL